MVRRMVIVVIAAALLLAAACTDDGTSGDVSVEGMPYVRALTTSLATDGVGDVELDRSQAACVAAKWVNVFEPERLDAAGIKPSALERDAGLDDKAAKVALSDGEVSKLVGAFGECEVDLRQAYLDSITSGATLSETDRSCLADAFSDGLIDEMMGLVITKGARAVDEDPALSVEVFQALSSCPGAIDVGS